MRNIFQKIGYLAILTIPLTFSAPVHAQVSTTPQAPPANGTPPSMHHEERIERRELREEREKIRAEHEKLEAEHDRLKAECMNAKGQERSACQQKREALHQKMEALHVRMKALHEKLEAEHKEHREGQGTQHPGGTPSAPAPTTPPAQ